MILPARDEAPAVPAVLAGLPPDVHPIVVDNGSTDGTGDLARSLGATVVDEPVAGFGRACWAGLHAATAPVVVFMDCDGSLAGDDIARVIEPLVADRADLVLGARVPVHRGAWPVHARLANRALTGLLRRRGGTALRDIGPLRAAHRSALLDLDLRDRRFGWPLEMVVRAEWAGWRIVEVPVSYHPRIGRSKVTGTVRGTLRTVRDMRAVLASHPDPEVGP